MTLSAATGTGTNGLPPSSLMGLQRGALSATNGVVLTDFDLNAVKKLADTLGSSNANTYLRAQSGVVNNFASLSSVAVLSASALVVSAFTQDSTAPTLSAFDLDMDGLILVRIEQ